LLIGPGATDGDRENETDQRAEGNARPEEYDITVCAGHGAASYPKHQW
jgi:hypothetical protein